MMGWDLGGGGGGVIQPLDLGKPFHTHGEL